MFLAGSYGLRNEDQLSDDSLVVTLWAKQPMLQNPVAISHDPEGRLYATEANRRKSVDLDVRDMKGLEPIPWPALDYSLESVEQRKHLLREYLDPENGLVHSWMRDYDGNGTKNWQDLRSKTERINLLEDTDGDGRADRSTVFAEGFNTEVTGTAGGVLWHDDQVYFTVIPDLWLLKDTDDDGVANERSVLASGHGVHIGQGGHDLHGLTIGPDGRIYWSIGDKGINITSKEGEHFFYPNQGVVLRSEPDGSRLEVFARGLRNCQEMTFDDYGNLFCVDNDGDFEGERERLVYITRGSDTGWRINWQYNHTNNWAASQRLPRYNPWMDENLWIPHFDEQAAYITPTLQNYSDGPAGFIRNPGTALSESYEDHYFLTQFPGKLITSFELKPSGAAFEMENESTFYEGFMATGVSFSPEGALYVADWAGNWEPTQEGGIFTIDATEENRHPLRDSTNLLIREGMKHRSTPELTALLGYPDQRVRMNAQFELVNRSATAELLNIATDRAQPQFARIHGLWGIGQLARKGVFRESIPMRALLNDPDHQIRIQACKLVTEAPSLFDWYENELIYLLKDPEPHVRFHAALSLTEIGTDRSIIPLFNLLESNRNEDPFIRHAAVSALAGIGDTAYLIHAASHPSSDVRRAAVVALRRLKDPGVSVFLHDEDPLVVTEAARAIHDDFGIPRALPDLAGLINHTPFTDNEALMRRVLNANLRLGETDHLSEVLIFAANDSIDSSLRKEALDIAHTWKAPPVLDRVERRYRVLPERDREATAQVVRDHIPPLLASTSSALKSHVFALVSEHGIDLDPGILQQLLSDETRPAMERNEALHLLSHQRGERNKAFRTAFESMNDSLRIEALKLASKLDTKRAEKRISTILEESTSTSERQSAYSILGEMRTDNAARILAPWVKRLLEGDINQEERLDVYLAASQYERFDRALSSINETTDLSFTLYGGNASRGADIFQDHSAAQCVRCHGSTGDGSNVGPDLTGIGSRVNRSYLLESLVEPSKTITEGYSGDVSIMPPMGSLLEATEIRDLIEYLSTL